MSNTMRWLRLSAALLAISFLWCAGPGQLYGQTSETVGQESVRQENEDLKPVAVSAPFAIPERNRRLIGRDGHRDRRRQRTGHGIRFGNLRKRKQADLRRLEGDDGRFARRRRHTPHGDQRAGP